MPSHAYFAGLDFSGARGTLANLWTCVGEPRGDRLHVISLRPHPFRLDAAAYLLNGWRDEVDASSDATLLAGLDFPLSLPSDAVQRAMGESLGFSAVNKLLASRSADEVAALFAEDRKTPRQCDARTAMAPLDLRVYKQTVEGARFIHELLETGEAEVLPMQPIAGASLSLIEVYPSVTSTDLGIKAPRKPKRPGEVFQRPAALAHYVSFDHPAMQAAAVTLEDAWDAVLACLTAYLVRDDLAQPQRVGKIDETAVQREGWIYRHPQAWR